MLIPISVLEGFSAGVASTIGFGQFNNALGLAGLTRHAEFYMNVYETFKNAGSVSYIAFVPFLCMFSLLMYLLKFKPGKPWIIFIALVGIFYGLATYYFFQDYKPTLLMDAYPAMQNPSIYDFRYLDKDYKWSTIMIGAFEVGFVAVLETLISARIADTLTGKSRG